MVRVRHAGSADKDTGCRMAWPMGAPAPVVSHQAAVCRDLVDHPCPVRQVQHDRTGLDRAAPQEPGPSGAGQARQRRRASRVWSLRTPAASRWGAAWMRGLGTTTTVTAPLPGPIPRSPASRSGGRGASRGAGACTAGMQPGRRGRPRWPSPFQPCRARPPPGESQRRHQHVEPVWLQDPKCRARHEPCRTTRARAIARVEEAIGRTVPWGVGVFDAGSLAEAWSRVLARRRQESEPSAPQEPRAGHRPWAPLGSGRRGLCAGAPDLCASWTGSNAPPPPRPWGRLSATGACGAAEALGVRPGPSGRTAPPVTLAWPHELPSREAWLPEDLSDGPKAQQSSTVYRSDQWA